MTNTQIYKKWEEFINDDKYKKYFITNRKDKWLQSLNELKEYLDKHKIRPLQKDKRIGKWLSHQITNYSKKIKSMNDSNIVKIWEKFINDDKYKIYFINNKTK